MKRVKCAYCGKSVLENPEANPPKVDDNDSWKKLKRNHYHGCEWIETRAHQAADGEIIRGKYKSLPC